MEQMKNKTKKGDGGMSWEKVKFRDIFNFENKSKNKAGDGLIEGKYPFYTSSAILSKYLNQFSHEKTSLIFGTGGNASIHFCEKPFSVSTDCLVAVSKDKISCYPKFVYYYLSGNINILEEGFKGAGLKHISKSFINDIEIPLPPLPIQQRIAEILDAADALRRKDQELLRKYDELAKAIFIDMFGDPVKNEKGWEVKEMSYILDKIESGWSPNCLNRSASLDEWGVLKLGSVTKCIFDDRENKALPKEELPRETLEVKVGDVLFSRKNTSNLVAACVLVKKTRPKLMMSDLIFRLKISKPSEIHPVYLQSLLVYPTKRAFIQSLAGGAAGSMPNISKEKLMSVEIELPPIEIQSSFAKKLNIIEAQKELIIASKSGILFDSLLQQAFKGELAN